MDLPLDNFKAPLSSLESSVIDSCSCCFNFSMTVSGTRSTFLSHDVEKLVKKEVRGGGGGGGGGGGVVCELLQQLKV